MNPSDISPEDYDDLISIVRRVTPQWLRKRHQTLSLAGQAVEELLTDEMIRDRFIQAVNDSDQSVVNAIWLKLARRIRDRLKKRLSRSREVPVVGDSGDEAIDVYELLDSIDARLERVPDAQLVFREFYVPLVDCTVEKRPSVAMVQSFLGSGVVWSREIRTRVEDAILAECKDF